MINRRKLLLGSLAFCISPWKAFAAGQREAGSIDFSWLLPRELHLTRPGISGPRRIVYFENGAVLPDGYIAACELLRDAQADVMTHIDLGLLNLLYAMQSALHGEAISKPLIISSGYRTPDTNAKTEGAVFASYHTQGRAADIRVDGVACDKLFALAAGFGAGGVGYYPDRQFIHVDNGNRRYWQG